MSSITYTLSGATEFVFPFPVASANQLTVEVQPGGVVSPGDYEILGLGPVNTQVTVVYPDAPTDGLSNLKLTRFVQPQRVGVINAPSDITVTNLNDEFDNIYMSVVDTADLTDFFYGSAASDPVISPQGNPVSPGDIYYNTSINQLRVFDGTNWLSVLANAGLPDVLDANNYLRTQGAWVQAGNLALEADAPIDSNFYLRVNSAWGAAGSLALKDDVPVDGIKYVRQNTAWTPASSGLPEAPSDGNNYVRNNAAWVQDPIQPDGGTITGPLIAQGGVKTVGSLSSDHLEQQVLTSGAVDLISITNSVGAQELALQVSGIGGANSFLTLGSSAASIVATQTTLELNSVNNINLDVGSSAGLQIGDGGGVSTTISPRFGDTNINFLIPGLFRQGNPIWDEGNLPNPLGQSGSYADFTTLRSFNTQFTNQNNRPLFAVVSVDGGATPGKTFVTVIGGVTVHDAICNQGQFISFIVPPGMTYEVQASTGAVLNNWVEFS